MLFWLSAALLTIAASLAVLWPLARGSSVKLDTDNDLRVYKDQLAEIDSDVARGAIATGEAEQARAEIGRRIVRQASSTSTTSISPASRAFRFVALAAVLSVPVVSWGLYGLIGSPDLPSQPLEARLLKSPGESSPDELIARAESHLAKNPDDGRGWDVLAPTYLRLGRFDDASTAYRNAIRLESESAARVAGLAEALTMANGGIVSAEAEATFHKALALDPKAGKARFFLAMGLVQDGKKAEAQAAWEAMHGDQGLDQQWRRAAEYALAQLAQQDVAQTGGPSQEAVDQAAAMSSQDRAAMIEQMVAGLDQKLRDNPDDPEGWIKLVRSYLVLGKQDEAKSAVKRAIDALGGDTEGGRKVAAFAADQGMSVTE
ncbi:MAG: c-type cytochrome biogenesis protein CcmI [Rhizobiaceae bacterium]